MIPIDRDLIVSELIKTGLYLEVLVNGITPYFASESEPEFNNYKPFQIGDILECLEKDKEIIINVIRDGIVIHKIDGSFKYINYLQFIVDNDKIISSKLSLFGILKYKYMKDITTECIRELKLKELGL